MLGHAIGHGPAQAPGNPERVESCAHCGQNFAFEMPEELLAAALAGEVVVFAGAGVSSESRQVDQDTFVERIATELHHEPTRLNFATVMSDYERRFGRPQLLQRIRERLDYIKSFPEIWSLATRFHRAVATAYFLDQIITTNWDTYFEELTAATPIVIPADYAFWNLKGRKVFKLHGSMHNLGSIVATKKDYDRCYRRLRTGVMGATLKHLLATKRAVFIGYSFGDSDLNRILAFLRKELGDILPNSYLVTPHGYQGTSFPADRVIPTDGTYFIQKLKEAAVERGHMRPDLVYARTFALAAIVERAHHSVSESFNAKDAPAAVHTLAYQDGLTHAFQRTLALASSGHYSNPDSTRNAVSTYELVRRGAIRLRDYWNASYAEGYRMGLASLDLDDAAAAKLPLYLIWGSNRVVRDFEDYSMQLEQAPRLHKAATAQAIRLVRNHPTGLVEHHSAYLDVDRFLEAAVPGLVASRRNRR